MAKRNSAPNRLIPLLFIGGGLAIIFGILIWQSLTNAPQPAASSPSGNAAGQPTAVPVASIQRVSLADARVALDAKTAVFVDVRDEDAYQADHIPGSLNIPLGEIETRYRELNPNQWIITYCT
jgi:hypothetical protein